MKRSKKQRKVLLYLIVVLGLTVGFALLSTTLKINGTASIKGNNWDIHWDDSSIVVNQDSVEAETPQVTGTDKDTLSFEVEFELPGEFYEFTIDAVNAGSVDGALDNITTKIYDSTDLEHELEGDDIPEYLLYSVTYDDGTPTTGDILKHGESQTYKIRMEFDEDWEELPDSDKTYVIKVEIPYVQHKEEQAVSNEPVTMTASKLTATKNEEVKVTVTVNAAAWNLHLTGAIVSDELVGGNSEGTNIVTTKEFTLDTSTPGEKVINLTGDITDEDDTNTSINKSITVTVTE